MIKKIIKKILNIKSGIIKQTAIYELKSQIITEPIAVKLDNALEVLQIIVGTQKGELLVIDENGKLTWRFKADQDINELDDLFLDKTLGNRISASPFVYDINNDGKLEIFFGTELGQIYALDSSGKIIWTFKVNSPVRGRINIFDFNNDSNPEIAFGSSDEYLYFLNTKGKLIKKIYVGAEIESMPVFFNNSIVVCSNDGLIRAFDKDGKNKWSVITESKINSEPIITKTSSGNEILLVGSTDNFLYCISTEGSVIWKYETGGSIYSKPVVKDLNKDGLLEIIFGSCDNNLYVLNERGFLLWKFETDFWITGSPIIMDLDNDGEFEIVFGSYDTQIYVLSTDGAYNIGFVPGLSGIVYQEGNYSEILLHDPGEIIGKKIWSLKTPGMIIGCCEIKNNLIVQTKEGQLIWVRHEEN